MNIQLIDYITDLEGFTPYYIYSICLNNQEIGTLVFREGNDQEHLYDGHIGYTIEKEYRGHHYAYEACLLLKEKIIEKGYDHVLITCDPHNIASLKTIEKLGGQYLKTLVIPSSLKKYYTPEEKEKRIYRWEVL